MDTPLPKIEGQPYTYQPFPAWCYGPNGEADVFNSEGEVPAGWKLPDGKTKGGKAAAPVDGVELDADGVELDADGVELDADGHPWNPDLHAATKTKTSAGLWRMKVGVSRPDPVPGEAPALDL